MHVPVSRSFRTFVLSKYPALEGNEPFLRLFHYLCFGNFFDKETHRLVVPTRMMSERFYAQPYHPRFNGKAVLESFRSAVLPNLAWTRHEVEVVDSWNGKARQIQNLGFDAEMQQALRAECLRSSDDLVDLVTGAPYSRNRRYRETYEATARYEQELAQVPLNATQEKILDYLRDLNYGHLFLRKFDDNLKAFEAAIETLAPEVRETRYRILASARRNPVIYYLPSAKERTCRLSGHGDSILGLKSSVRKALCAGWVECDLRSSQFSILAAKLKAPISRAFIASGDSIWRSFYQHTHGINEDPPKAIKKVFKEAMYSLCFGKGVGNLTRMLNDHKLVKLLSHPILQELLTLRTVWFEEIRDAGGAFDVWGRWQALDLSKDLVTKKTRRWEGAVAASVIQSIEMEIIAPIFDVANANRTSSKFTICLFRHDGATISFNDKDRVEGTQNRLKKAVEARAKELGVSTVLDFTQL